LRHRVNAQWEEQPMTVTMAVNPRNTPAAPCLTDPDRWAAGGDDPEMKTLCRSCPRRWLCAKEAVETPGAAGMWSGVNLPAGGRARAFSLRQLRSLAAHGGYTAREPEPDPD
jgi:WhiB family redox-sensing transcriptional regulator